MSKRAFAASLLPLVAAMAMGLPTAVGGDEHEEMASEAAMEGKSHYVIKVTPTLVYLDAGSEAGAHGDQSFVIIREHEGMYVPVGHVTLIRVYESFSIAEINSIATGEEISVLDRVVMADEWERMAPEMESMAAAERRRDPAGGRGRPKPGRWLPAAGLARGWRALPPGAARRTRRPDRLPTAIASPRGPGEPGPGTAR